MLEGNVLVQRETLFWKVCDFDESGMYDIFVNF
jgi:hypothetical protein